MTYAITTSVVRIVDERIPHKKVLLRASSGNIWISTSEAQLVNAPSTGFKLPSESITIEYRGDIYAISDATGGNIEILYIPDIGQEE